MEVYIIESRRFLKKVTIVRQDTEFTVVKFEEGGGIRIRNSRIFEKEEDARKRLEFEKHMRIKFRSALAYRR